MKGTTKGIIKTVMQFVEPHKPLKTPQRTVARITPVEVISGKYCGSSNGCFAVKQTACTAKSQSQKLALWLFKYVEW